MLAERIRRIAEAGRLRVSEERPAHLVTAAGRGIALTLIAMPAEHRDLALSDLGREAVIAAITTDAAEHPSPGPITAAVALRAVLPQTDALSVQERGLLQSGSTASPRPGPAVRNDARGRAGGQAPA